MVGDNPFAIFLCDIVCTLSFNFEMNVWNCSLEFNSSNRGISPMLLMQFLLLGNRSEACFVCPTGCPSLALQLGVAQPLYQGTLLKT